MKKALYTAAIILSLSTLFNQSVNAQDNWTQGKTGIYSGGIGGTQLISLTGNNYGNGYTRTSNVGLSLNFSGEYKVWNWIGAGFQTGVDFIWLDYNYSSLYYHAHYSGGPVTIAIPFGGKVNAHILDAVGAGIANKLDVYGGINLGFGPAFYTGTTAEGQSSVGAIMHVGPQVGARYWFNQSIAIFAEFGWGATFANAGVTF